MEDGSGAQSGMGHIGCYSSYFKIVGTELFTMVPKSVISTAIRLYSLVVNAAIFKFT